MEVEGNVALVVMAASLSYISPICVSTFRVHRFKTTTALTACSSKSAQMCDLRLYFCSKTCHPPIKNSNSDSGFDHSCAHPIPDPPRRHMSSSKPSGGIIQTGEKIAPVSAAPRTADDHSCTKYKNRIIFPLLLAVWWQRRSWTPTKYEIWGKLYYNSTSKLHVSLRDSGR